MKATFFVNSNIDILQQLEEIATKYNASVKLADDGESHYILIKPKFQIKKNLEGDQFKISVWGGSEEDISYLTSLWGTPQTTAIERLPPVEFAVELVTIPEIDIKSKEEIMDIMEVDEKGLMQYTRLFKALSRRPDASSDIRKSLEILEKLGF